MNWPERNQQTINRALGIIQHIPFTRAVSLTGSLAENRATERSDIDFFVQVQPGHLWSTRFVVTLLLQLAGIRRTDDDIVGKICLNWFATFNAPAQQAGRAYHVLWQEHEPGPIKALAESLLTNPLGRFLEARLRAHQIRRIEADPRTHLPGSQVRYPDSELGFHPPKQK